MTQTMRFNGEVLVIMVRFSSPFMNWESTQSLICCDLQAGMTYFVVPKDDLVFPGTFFDSVLSVPNRKSSGGGVYMDHDPDFSGGFSKRVELDQSITALQFTHFLSLAVSRK